MTALATSNIDELIILARYQLPAPQFGLLPARVIVCPEVWGMLTYNGTMCRNALHTAALQYVGRLWDVDRDDLSMVQFLLEFRAWIDTPGREVVFR